MNLETSALWVVDGICFGLVPVVAAPFRNRRSLDLWLAGNVIRSQTALCPSRSLLNFRIYSVGYSSHSSSSVVSLSDTNRSIEGSLPQLGQNNVTQGFPIEFEFVSLWLILCTGFFKCINYYKWIFWLPGSTATSLRRRTISSWRRRYDIAHAPWPDIVTTSCRHGDDMATTWRRCRRDVVTMPLRCENNIWQYKAKI